MSQIRFPERLRLMIPSLMGASVPMVYVLLLLFSAKVSWLIYGVFGSVSLIFLIAFFISQASRRTLLEYEGTFEQFKISEDPERKDEYRLGVALGLGVILLTGLICFTIRAF